MQHSTTMSKTATLPSSGGVYSPTDLKQFDYESCTLIKNKNFPGDSEIQNNMPNKSISSVRETTVAESAAAGKVSSPTKGELHPINSQDENGERKDKKQKKLRKIH